MQLSASHESLDTDTDSTDLERGYIWHPKVKVRFFPPLQDTRRAWILSKLRQEQVISVLDIGCGDGTLLSCLCNAPPFLDKDEHPNAADGLPDLHITRLVGLDVYRPVLEQCIVHTAPPNESKYHGLPRWEQLEVKIWLGSLDAFNLEFVDMECIVATEVVEHLPEELLSKFAPVILGLYRPRLLLITTPNYSFNARFSAPGTVDASGIPDPTGRTDRLFRHYDHKFEWTVDEFKSWCTDAASTWGYSVEVDAVGLLDEPDPWGRDEELGRASQVALFRRLEDWKGQKATPTSLTEEQSHQLLKIHVHSSHAHAGIAGPHEKIRELISKHMESYYFEEGYSVWDLWIENSISIACGGHFDVLLKVIEASPDYIVTRPQNAPTREWRVKFTEEKHRELVEVIVKSHAWKSKWTYSSTLSPQGDEKHTDGFYETGRFDWPQTDFEWAGQRSTDSLDKPETTWSWGSRVAWDMDKLSISSTVE